MNNFFRVAFGLGGDRTPIPIAVEPSGTVSYTEGYGPDYQLVDTDPDSKNIERDKMNSLFYEVTLALQELQSQGVPDFITSVLNGGTPYSYSHDALVRWTDGFIYLSLVNANTTDPSNTTNWARLPTPDLIQQAAYSSASAGGTANALTATFTPAITTLAGQVVLVRVASANSNTTPTLQANATAAKTIVKGNNLPLIANDLPGTGAWAMFKHDVTLDKWVLLNPATGILHTAATETQAGVAEIATQAEMDARTDDTRIATPLKLGFGFAISLGNSGYIKFPSWLGGFILQWGQVSVTANTAVSVSFPLVFPNNLYWTAVSWYRTVSPAPAAPNPLATENLSTAQLRVYNSAASSEDGRWLAIGR